MSDAGLGYTLASGRLFAPMQDFQPWCESLLGRPIYTHEFGDRDVWDELRIAFEAMTTEEMMRDRSSDEGATE